MSHLVACGLVLVMSSCSCTGKNEATTKKKQRVRVRSFTEPTQIRLLQPTKKYVFSAAGVGLDRWELKTGTRIRMTKAQGLPDDGVSAMAYDAGRDWLWVATNTGLVRYNSASDTFTPVPPAPSVFKLDSIDEAVLAPAGDGGVWLGVAAGLFYTNDEGKWKNTGVTEPVTALMRTKDGTLWIGTSKGLIGRKLSGEAFRYTPDLGCDLSSVRFIVRAPGGGAVVVGENAQKQQRIVLPSDDKCESFRAAPAAKWLAASSRADEVIIRTADRLFALRTQVRGARYLRRDGMRLLRVPNPSDTAKTKKKKNGSPYVLQLIDLKLPKNVTAVAAAAGEILIGTRDVGIRRLALDDGANVGTGWLRSGDLMAGATSLSVACRSRDDCYIATGTKRVWWFNGKTFRAIDDGTGTDVLAVVRKKKGPVYALKRAEAGTKIVLATINNGSFSPVPSIGVKTPGAKADITFARFSPGGLLWLGLRYLAKDGEWSPWGVATIQMSFGLVVYHRATFSKKERKRGVLPIPIEVVDAAFMDNDEAWLATTEGATRVRGSKITVFGEAEGLRSELLSGVTTSSGGVVYAATAQGVATYDGESWSHPAGLARSVNDLEISRDGRLWMATDRGLAVFDGRSVRRLDARRGLVENKITHVVIDRYNRIWARGKTGLTIVSM